MFDFWCVYKDHSAHYLRHNLLVECQLMVCVVKPIPLGRSVEVMYSPVFGMVHIKGPF